MHWNDTEKGKVDVANGTYFVSAIKCEIANLSVFIVSNDEHCDFVVTPSIILIACGRFIDH